jgi:Tfp pilus assembly protein PilX
MRTQASSRKGATRQRGVALIVTLSMLVLLTAATLAFFTRATANRTIENSRANKVLADQLAKTGADYAAGLILGEIDSGSTKAINNGFVIYRPSNVTNAVPQRILAQAGLTNDANFFNLVRQTTDGTHNSAALSQNGRAMTTSRWNAPILLGGAGFTATNQLPNWIYVNRDGTATNQPTTNSVGRFACNVYDIGGLLDANLAGYPSTVTAGSTNLAILKGSVAGADLTLIPGVTDPNAFVRWRNAGTASSAASYVTGVSNAASTGFLRPSTNDHRLQSRQDLIAAARNGTVGLATNALPYLTTFSRAVNAPSWYPTSNASQMTANYLDTLKDPAAPRNYASDANNSTSVNRNITGVFAASGWRRMNGEATVAGEPLIKHRFPLSWLALLGDANPATTAWDVTPEATTVLNNLNARRAANGQSSLTVPTLVQQAFGLTWNSGSGAWEYRAATILRLDEVAGREPDFFELLKAGILNGSLGKSTPADTAFIANFSPDRNKDLQILKIGANIIDQADSDDAPTMIVRPLQAEVVLGVENHPYIYMMSQTHFRRKDMPPDPAAGDPPVMAPDPSNPTGPPIMANPMPWTTGYQQMQVWNPHVNAAVNAARTYRIRALQGSSRISAAGIGRDGPLVTQNDRSIAFSGSASFAEPTLLNKNNIDESNTSQENMLWRTPNAGNAILAGFHIGNLKLNNNLDGKTPDKPYDDYGPPNALSWLVISPQIPIVYQLEYLDGGRWIPVQRAYPVKGTYGNGLWGGAMWTGGKGEIWDFTEIIYNGGKFPSGGVYNTTMMLVACKTDPRAQRLGVFGAGGVPPDNTTLRRSNANSGYPAWHTVDGMSWDCNTWKFLWRATRPLPTALAGRNEPADATLDDLSDNRMDSPTLIADPDGVVRPADGTRRTNIPGVGSPARPVMLNRPFRSVGEIGYAFRDDPWKTLDVSSAYSADAALLDFFSVAESPAAGVTAGTVNLNTRQQPVLQAVLAGALKNETNSTATLTTSEVGGIASAMIAATRTTPLLNRAELATRIVAVGTNSLSSADDKDIKTRRESIVRALADAGQTRTWNLLIDVVAQSGRFPATGTASPPGPGDFVVESESRSWVSIAIDRYTGQIVAQNVESVND